MTIIMASLPKVGIFGTGPLVRVLLPHIRNEGFVVVAIWGEGPEEAAEAARDLNIDFSTSHVDDVLLHKEVGLLMILCQPVNHAEIAVKALGIGKHVYVHPPCSINTAETLRMVQAAAYYPSLVAVVGHGLRALPAAVEMKRLLQDGYVGQTISHCDVRLSTPSLIGNSTYSWKCSESMGGGVLNQYGCHTIDLLLYLTGQRAARVHGVFKTLQKTTSTIRGIRQITADDVASIDLETSANCLATLSLHAQSSSFSQELIVTGDEGQLVMRNASLYGRKIGMDNHMGEEMLYLDTASNSNLDKASNSKNSSNSALPDLYVEGYTRLFRQLKETLLSQDNKHKLATFEDALHTASVIEAVRKSSREKVWAKVAMER